MNIYKKFVSTAIILCITLSSMLCASVSTFAAAPSKESVEYKGQGKVEIEFASKVRYKRPKVTVRDSSGKRYKAQIIERDDDDIDIRIKKYKAGKKYTLRISGVKKSGTKKYGTVKATITIPSAAKSINAQAAKDKALNDAVQRFGINKSTARKLTAESDTYKGTAVWEVDFVAKKNGTWYEYEYQIGKANGKIMKYEQELD